MESQIAPLVDRSLVSFKILSDSVCLSQNEHSSARSHLARFKLWAGSLGAHRSSGGRSLEYRLRDSSFVRNHIISLLQELVSTIDEGIQLATTDGDDKNDKNATNASDDTNTDLDLYFQSEEQSDSMVILDDIGHIVDCLLRLSITIRNPAPHDQFNSRAGAETVSSYMQWDMNHIREKFSHLDSHLVDRLGMAMARRRQYLKYREEHSKRLAHGLLGEADEGDNATTIASSIPNPLKEVDNLASFNEMERLFDGMSETSGTSYAPSNAATNELRVPNIPRVYVDGPFQCPFCHMVIMINDRNSWKKHVFRDLQPYVCLFDNCSVPSQLYQRRKDWVAHMKQEHWVSWSCSFGCSGSFDTQESFKRHLTTIHGQNPKSIDLQAVMNLCGFPDDRNMVGVCPLCLDYQIQSSKRYQAHVGDHLERLALFVLPHTVYDAGDDDDGDREQIEENDGNRSHRQESYRDDNSESEELEGVRETGLTDYLNLPLGQAGIDPPFQKDNNIISEAEERMRRELERLDEEGHFEEEVRKPTEEARKAAEDERKVAEEAEAIREEVIKKELELERLKGEEHAAEKARKAADVIAARIEERIEKELELERLKEEEEAHQEKLRRDGEVYEAVERYTKAEADRIAREKEEQKRNDEEYERRLREDLAESGVDELGIDAIINSKKVQQDAPGVKEHPPKRPNYTRMSRKHLSIETLRTFSVDFEYDNNPEYVLIKRWVPEWEQDHFWQHTKSIRAKRTESDVESFFEVRNREGERERELMRRERELMEREREMMERMRERERRGDSAID